MDYTNPNMKHTGHAKPVRCIDPMTKHVHVYESIAQAVMRGYNAAMITRACNSKRTTYKGLYWEFIDSNKPEVTKVSKAYEPKSVRSTNIKTGAIKTYSSAEAATRDGFDAVGVIRACRKIQDSHGGCEWEFVADD